MIILNKKQFFFISILITSFYCSILIFRTTKEKIVMKKSISIAMLTVGLSVSGLTFAGDLISETVKGTEKVGKAALDTTGKVGKSAIDTTEKVGKDTVKGVDKTIKSL